MGYRLRERGHENHAGKRMGKTVAFELQWRRMFNPFRVMGEITCPKHFCDFSAIEDVSYHGNITY